MGSTILISLLNNKKLWLLLFVIVLCALLLFSVYCGIDLYKKFGVKSEINGNADGSHIISETETIYKVKEFENKTLLLNTNVIDFEIVDNSGKKEYIFDPIEYDTACTYFLMINDTLSPCNVDTSRYLSSNLSFIYKEKGKDFEFNLNVFLSFNKENFKLRFSFNNQTTLSYFNEMLVNDGFELYLVSYKTDDIKGNIDISINTEGAYSEYVTDGSGDSTDKVTEIVPVEEDTEFNYLFDLTHSEINFALCELPEGYDVSLTHDDDEGCTVYTCYTDYASGNFVTTVLPKGVKTTVRLDKNKKYILCSDHTKICSTAMPRTLYYQANTQKEFTHDNTAFMSVETDCFINIVNYDFVTDTVSDDLLLSGGYCTCKEHAPIKDMLPVNLYGHVERYNHSGSYVFTSFSGNELFYLNSYSAMFIDCEEAK